MKTRIISTIIAVAIVLSVIPTATVTAEETPVEIVVGHMDGKVLRYNVDNALSAAGLSRESDDVIFSVTFTNGVTSISDDAFQNCTSLTSITIPDRVT